MHKLENSDIFNLKDNEQIVLPILKRTLYNLKIFVFKKSLQNYEDYIFKCLSATL